MKKILILCVALTAMISCHKKSEVKNELVLSFADSTAYKGKKIYLCDMKNLEHPLKIDSTVIASSGKVTFIRKGTDTVSVQLVTIPDLHQQFFFINEKGKIDIELKDNTSTIKGTPINDSLQSFIDRSTSIMKTLMTLKEQTPENEAKAKPLIAEQNKLLVDFIRPNIKNKVGEFFFKNSLMYIDEADRTSLLKGATPEFKKEMESLLKPMQNEGIGGQHFLDLNGTTPDGKTVKLSDYAGNGKIVLLDFWASWCGPCREEMPNVVEAYAKYKNKGFEIVGVSLDKDKAAWVKAIKDLKITWIQMSDLKGWDSQLAAVYKVQSIPFTVLIDKDGTIIGENLRGEDLQSKLKELLK